MLIVIQATLSNHGHKTTVTKTMQQDQKDLYFMLFPLRVRSRSDMCFRARLATLFQHKDDDAHLLEWLAGYCWWIDLLTSEKVVAPATL